MTPQQSQMNEISQVSALIKGGLLNIINRVIKSPATQTPQDPTRHHNLAEAQRVYAATQAAYARQQVERTSVANSPANFSIGLSPVQLGTPSIGNDQSPAVAHEADGNSNVNGNTVDRAPTPASAKAKKKPARITVDTEVGDAADLDAPQSGAASATSKRKTPSTGKRPLKSATVEKPTKGKTKVRQLLWREDQGRWLPWLTFNLQTKAAKSPYGTQPTGDAIRPEEEGPAQTPSGQVGQTPGSTQSTVYPLPVQTPSQEQPTTAPPGEIEQDHLESQAALPPPPTQIPAQTQTQAPQNQNTGFEAPFEFDDSNELFKMLDFNDGDGGGFDNEVFNFEVRLNLVNIMYRIANHYS